VRQQSLEFLLGMISMLPEGGRENLIQDVIAARSGQFSVERYFPTSLESQRNTDQHAHAMLWVAAMKAGITPIVTDTQKPVIYVQTFIQAAAQAFQSLQQGANPVEVARFLDTAGAAIAVQLEQIKADPTRKNVYDALHEQWKKLAELTDQLKAKIQSDAEANQENMAAQQQAKMIENGQEPSALIAAAKAQNDMKWKSAKNAQALDIKARTASQKLAINDASAAAKISRATIQR
jgi:hypothetical protein